MEKPKPFRIPTIKPAGIGSKRPVIRRPVLRMKGAAPTPVAAPPSRYKILEVLGEGGVGIVSHAWDTLLKMDVAIKALRPEIAQDQEAVAQLKSEAAMAMKLSHENIVRLHNMDVENGQIFLVMEYVKGQTLAAISQHMGALSLPAVLDIAHACCSALDYAHANGVVHRDIKPDNLMVTESMQLKLMDFGIAMKAAREASAGDYLEGSPGYMSPEQLLGHEVDARTDVFSLAVVLCELLTGQRAFPGEVDPHMYDREPCGIETLPVPVATVLRRGMARDVNERSRLASTFYVALEHAVKPLMG